MTSPERRFRRQIARLQAGMPRLGAMLGPRSRLRVPVGLALVLGGLLGFLPILGFWMLPLGLLLLAVDLPALRPAAGRAMIGFRRLGRGWRRWRQGRRTRRGAQGWGAQAGWASSADSARVRQRPAGSP